jgi:cytochrome c biogenesis protein CcmG, thiol:disulfide interchange protein DsbE
MYRPDYHSRSHRTARWGLPVVLGLVIGLIGAGLIDGWWDVQLSSAANSGTATGAVVLPAPIAATGLPRVLEPVAATRSSARVQRPAGGPSIAPERTVAPGEAAPDFALPDLFDEPLLYRLSDYRGRPVILNFWASWCVPCRREMPALQTTAARYEADGLLLLGMNQTYIDDLEAARTFVKELGLIFPNTRDDSGSVGADAYQVIGIPTSVFINAEGEVVQIQIGEMSLEQLAAYSERLIAGEPLLP